MKIRTIGIQIVGLKEFGNKDNSRKYRIAYYVSEPWERDVKGSQAGSFFLDEEDIVKIGDNYTASVAYDRNGRLGIVGIV